MFYYADIFVESVQYGHRTALCQLMFNNQYKTNKQVFQAATQFGFTNGVAPGDYDTSMLA